MNKDIVLTAVISAVGGAVVGGVITYVTVKNKLEARYALMADSAISDVKRHYALALSNHERKFETMETATTIETVEVTEEDPRMTIGREFVEQYGSPGQQSALVSEATQTIWDQGVTLNEDGEPVEEEIHIHAAEDGLDVDEDGIPIDYEIIDDEPHLVSESYFFENPQEFDMDTLTYFEIDDTLVDEQNAIVERVEQTIGSRHLNMFVRDRNKPKQSFYIRNEGMKTLFEVIMSEESYAETVLGINPEDLGLKEPKKRPKKMRKDDD